MNNRIKIIRRLRWWWKLLSGRCWLKIETGRKPNRGFCLVVTRPTLPLVLILLDDQPRCLRPRDGLLGFRIKLLMYGVEGEDTNTASSISEAAAEVQADSFLLQSSLLGSCSWYNGSSSNKSPKISFSESLRAWSKSVSVRASRFDR